MNKSSKNYASSVRFSRSIYLSKLVPAFLIRFVEQEEQRILKAGKPLAAMQQDDARKVGVEHPELIRVLAVKRIQPRKGWIRDVCGWIKAYPPDTAGCTYRYGVMIRSDLADYTKNRELYLHEFAHVAQYERYGSISSFLAAYLPELVYPGYGEGPLEKEADHRARSMAR